MDSGRGPDVPALSSTALPNLLDMIGCLWLSSQSSSKEVEPPEGQQDLLESLTVKEVPKPSNTKDAYQKFLDILEEQSSTQDPALKPGNPVPNPVMGDPPVPPSRMNPPLAPGLANPLSNAGVPTESNWKPGKIPTEEEEPKKVFAYRNPCTTIPPYLLCRSLIPSHLFHVESRTLVEENQQKIIQVVQGEASLFNPVTSLWIILTRIHPQTRSQTRGLPPMGWQSPPERLSPLKAPQEELKVH